MSLNCFFGIEVRPDGVPVNPVIPHGSSLIITQCAVTSVVPPRPTSTNSLHHEGGISRAAEGTNTSSSSPCACAYSPVTLYVQSNDIPKRFAVCTISPQHRVTFCPLQLIFSRHVVFSLVGTEAGEQKGKTPGTVKKGDASETQAAFPTVHLTGYYESDERSDEDEDEEDENEDDNEDELYEELTRSARGRGRRERTSATESQQSSTHGRAAKKRNGAKQAEAKKTSKRSSAPPSNTKGGKRSAHHKRQR